MIVSVCLFSLLLREQYVRAVQLGGDAIYRKYFLEILIVRCQVNSAAIARSLADMELEMK